MAIQRFYDPLSYGTPVYTTQIDYTNFKPARDRTNLPGMTKLISRLDKLQRLEKKAVEQAYNEYVYKHPEATTLSEKEITPDDSVSQFRGK